MSNREEWLLMRKTYLECLEERTPNDQEVVGLNLALLPGAQFSQNGLTKQTSSMISLS